jgi:hypothetical protein
MNMSISYDPGQGFDAFGTPVGLIGYAVFVVGLWLMLQRAGLPGWGAIIPVYNLYLVIKLGGLSGWMIFLFLIPIVNIFAGLYVAGRVSEAFGYGVLMAIFGLFLFPPLGFLMIGISRSPYLLPRFGRTVSDNGA